MAQRILLSQDLAFFDYLEHLAYQFEPMIKEYTGDGALTWLEKEFGLRKAPSSLFPSEAAQRWQEGQEKRREKLTDPTLPKPAK